MDLLNKIVATNIKEYEINSIDELEVQQKCIDIILRHPINLHIPKYKKKYKLEDSFCLSHMFLEDLSEEYAKHLLKRLDEGAFLFDYSEEGKENLATSKIINGKPQIYIPFNNSLECSFQITHEFIHDMTIVDGYNDTRMLFCEVMSTWAEMLQSKYFEELGIKESIIRPREIQERIHSKALNMSFELELMKLYLENGYIKNSDIVSIINKHDYQNYLIYHFHEMMDTENLDFGFQQRYIYGYLLTTYMLEKSNKKEDNYRDFLILNEKLNNYKITQFINYLDLDYVDTKGIFDFDNKSYKKLEDSYVKQIKKIR